MKQNKIAVFVGSLRKESFNRKMAKALMKLSPDSLALDIVEIGELPLYDQDYDDEGKPPLAWTEFRQQPEVYIGNATNLFDESGNLANDSTREFATKCMHAFSVWVETNTSGRE